MHRTTYFFHISPDQLRVTLHSVQTAAQAIPLHTSAELNRLLQDKAIVHGLDSQILARAVAIIDGAAPLDSPLQLATGTPPVAAVQGLQLQFALFPLTFAETDENGHSQQTQVMLSPLVRAGEVLVQQGPPVDPRPGKDVFGHHQPAPRMVTQHFLAGDLVASGQEPGQLIAVASGYPVVKPQKKGADAHQVVSIEKLIEVTPDRMQALLRLRPAPPGQCLPDLDLLHRICDQEGIRFGRLPHATEQCLHKAAQEQRPQQAVIALGTLPVRGKDAWLRFVIEIGPLPGKLLGNGEIDFRERNMFIAVNQGQLIAVKNPPTEGTPGRDIFGEPVAAQAGSDILVKVADEAAFDTATGEIRATRAGVLSKVSEGSVKVCCRQVIGGDIDFEIGNINSNAALDIKGSIMPKFKVTALGDILVGGTIEKAQVKSGGNVVVQGGLIGASAEIQAKGDVDLTIVEHGGITADGTIILRKSAFSSRLLAGGDIHGDASSRVIHCQLIAAGSITAGRVGSENAEPTLLAAAVSPLQMQRLLELKEAMETTQKEIETVKMRQGRTTWSEELDELIADLEALGTKLARLNLICSDLPKSPDQGLAHALGCSIVIRGKVFEGTEVRIGNSRLVLASTLVNVKFQLQDHLAAVGGRSKSGIIVIPLTP